MSVRISREIVDLNYQRQRKFFVLYIQLIKIPKFSFASTAIDALERFEKESMANARKGLSLAINDAVEDTDDWSIDAVREFDRILAENGAATLTELRVKHSKKYRKIVKKGAIRSEVEYYLIKGIMDGMQEHIPDEDLPLLDSMLVEYENAQGS